jgi:hypothetical protein
MPENPYAFPQPFIRRPDDGQFESANQFDFGGMELRDYFAGQALAGNCGFSLAGGDGVTASQLAEEAYNIADAMLAAREKKTETPNA